MHFLSDTFIPFLDNRVTVPSSNSSRRRENWFESHMDGREGGKKVWTCFGGNERKAATEASHRSQATGM